MPSQPSSASEDRLLVCNCFKTMDLSDSGNALGNRLAAPVCSQLCRDEIGLFESAIADGQPFAVACTQEAPLFREIAEEADASDRVRFFNIRETAGWSETQENLTPKILALTAEADLQALQRPAPAKTLSSDGLCMIYGAGQAALDAALALEGILSVTLVLTSTDDVLLPPVLPFPIFCGHIRSLEGALGGFQVVLDGYAPMLPSSRRTPEFLLPKDGARSSCSVVIDLSGHTAPVTAPHKRDGYLRADPADPLAVSRVLHTAGELIGDFEKPVYVAYQSDICAHSHAGKTGCSKCLDACPAGAIHSLGTMIEVDPAICGGCGSCAVVCPTGAISYQYPYRDDLIDRVQALAGTFLNASGSHPELLIHSMDHGFNLISALARYGNGLPAHVLPLGLHTVTSFGHEAMITAFLAGFQRIFILADPKDAEELAALTFEMEMVRALLTGMGHSAEHRLTILTENDPDRLENALAANSPLPLGHQPARIAPKGSKRDVARLAITTLRTLPIHSRMLSISPLPRLMDRSQSTPTAARCAWPACRHARQAL